MEGEMRGGGWVLQKQSSLWPRMGQSLDNLQGLRAPSGWRPG